MTRIIKKRKKIVKDSDQQKKVEGKNLQQSGDFFQKNKTLLTWALVLAFLMTCFGVSGMMFSGCIKSNGKDMAHQGEGGEHSQPKDDVFADISYHQGLLSQNPDDSLLMGNLAYAYQSAAMKLQMKDEVSGNKANETQISDFLKQSEDYYKKAFDADPNYSFAAVNLMETYIMGGRPEEAIAFGERVVADKKLMDKKPPTDPSAFEESNFSPVLVKLVNAYSKAGQQEKALALMGKALELNPDDLSLLYFAAKEKSLKDAKAVDKKEAAELIARASSIVLASRSAGASADKVLEHYKLKEGLEILELQGDISILEDDKELAGQAFQMASDYAAALEDKASVERIARKVEESGAKPPVSVVGQEETDEGVVVKLSDGRTVTIPKDKMDQAKNDRESGALGQIKVDGEGNASNVPQSKGDKQETKPAAKAGEPAATSSSPAGANTP